MAKIKKVGHVVLEVRDPRLCAFGRINSGKTGSPYNRVLHNRGRRSS
jgi:hypothetical protein